MPTDEMRDRAVSSDSRATRSVEPLLFSKREPPSSNQPPDTTSRLSVATATLTKAAGETRDAD